MPRSSFAPSILVLASVGFAAGLFGLPGCAERARSHPAEPAAPAIPVAVSAAARAPVERGYEASGTVRGRNTAVLTSRIMANLREVKVKGGDPVKAGQILAVLDDTEARAAVRRAEAELAAAQEARAEAEQAVRASEATMRVARTNHERMQQLLSAGAATQQTYDDAEARDQTTSASHALALARVRGATARIDEVRAALEGAQASLGYTRIVAPFSGRVIDRRVDPGTQAAPGIPLLVIEQEGALRVEAAVDESQAGHLEVGQTAHVSLEALGHDVQGRITEVVPAVDPASRAFVIKVELPPALEALLRPGMFARVRFAVGVDERLMVPASAITLSGDLERLFVVQGERADLRLVTLGHRQGGAVEVLSGLDPGELVMTNPPADLRDGARVAVQR